MTVRKLAFGYNRAIPTDGVRAAWGARFIVTMNGHVDLPPDRATLAGDKDDTHELVEIITTKLPKYDLVDKLRDGLVSGTIHTREDKEHIFYEDNDVLIVGNANASAGYFYVTALLKN